MEIGGSLYDEEGAKIVPEIMVGLGHDLNPTPTPTPTPTLTPAQARAKEKNVEIILPVDFVTSSKFGEDGEIATVTKVRVRVRP